MTDKKFTDEEIIKALECHINAEDCVGCEMFGRCDEIILTKLVLDLINRQKVKSYNCPVCGKGSLIGGNSYYPKYCSNCGQALDWSYIE